MKTRMATSLAGAAILALTLLAPVAGAQATPTSVGAKPAPVAAEEPVIEPTFAPRIEEGKHCWTALDTGQSVCVEQEAELAEAVAEETGATVVIGATTSKASKPTGSLKSTTSSTARLATTSSAVAISTIYDDINYRGGSFTMAYTNANCSTATYGFPNLGSYGWNGRVSSFKSYNGCKTALWSGTSYTGSSYGYQSYASSLGSFNDDARSWRAS